MALNRSYSPPPTAVLMAIPVKCHHQKARLGVLFLAADSVFRGTHRNSVRMDLNRSTPPPRICSVHRWIDLVSRYVAPHQLVKLLTVGIRREMLRLSEIGPGPNGCQMEIRMKHEQSCQMEIRMMHEQSW